MKEKKERLELRVTKSEKNAIHRKAAKCGLTISEYVRKRALGYEPRGLRPMLFSISREGPPS